MGYYDINYYDSKLEKGIEKRKSLIDFSKYESLTPEDEIKICKESIFYFYKHVCKLPFPYDNEILFNPVNIAMLYLADNNKSMYINSYRVSSKSYTAKVIVLYNILFSSRAINSYISKSSEDYQLFVNDVFKMYNNLHPYIQKLKLITKDNIHDYIINNIKSNSSIIICDECEWYNDENIDLGEIYKSKKNIRSSRINSVIYLSSVSDGAYKKNGIARLYMDCIPFTDISYAQELNHDLYHVYYNIDNTSDFYSELVKVLNADENAIRRELDVARNSWNKEEDKDDR